MGCNCSKSETFTFNDENINVTISSGIHSIRKDDKSIHVPIVSEDEQLRRLDICRTCKYYSFIIGKEKCNFGHAIFLKAKTSLVDQSCPDTQNNNW